MIGAGEAVNLAPTRCLAFAGDAEPEVRIVMQGVEALKYAVAELVARHPVVGCGGGLEVTADRQGHGALDVVPRIAVATLEPGDQARGQLQVRQVRGTLGDLGLGEDPGNSLEDVGRPHVAGFTR